MNFWNTYSHFIVITSTELIVLGAPINCCDGVDYYKQLLSKIIDSLSVIKNLESWVTVVMFVLI